MSVLLDFSALHRRNLSVFSTLVLSKSSNEWTQNILGAFPSSPRFISSFHLFVRFLSDLRRRWVGVGVSFDERPEMVRLAHFLLTER